MLKDSQKKQLYAFFSMSLTYYAYMSQSFQTAAVPQPQDPLTNTVQIYEFKHILT